MALKTLTLSGLTLNLHSDDGQIESPREYAQSTFFGFHRAYASPDEAPDADPETARDIANHKDNICVPVYLYVHGGTAYKASTNGNPFHCPWDSGLFGFIYISRKDARKARAVSRITESIRLQIIKELRDEVAEYNTWANGEALRWEIIGADGEHISGVGGYFDEANAWAEGLQELSQEVRTTHDFDEDMAA